MTADVSPPLPEFASANQNYLVLELAELSVL